MIELLATRKAPRGSRLIIALVGTTSSILLMGM